MGKKGQVVLFIVVGLTILIGFTYMLLLSDEEGAETQLVRQTSGLASVSAVESYLDACFQEKANDAIEEISMHGGYTNPISSVEYKFIDIPVYEDSIRNNSPTMEQVEQEASYAIEEKLMGCMDELPFPGVSVDAKSPKVTLAFSQGKTVTYIDYPLRISAGEQMKERSSFSLETPIDVAKLYGVSQAIVAAQLGYPRHVCVSCLSDIAQGQDAIIEYEQINDRDVVFSVAENKKNAVPFLFALRFQ